MQLMGSPVSAIMATPPPFQVMAHGDMVTSLDVLSDYALMSGGLDKALCYWDVRTLSSGVNGPVARTEVRGRSLRVHRMAHAWTACL